MDTYKCKFCFRLFNNGRALGGHMKSHLAFIPKYPPKQQKQEQKREHEQEEDCSFLSSSSPIRKRSKRAKRPSRTKSLEPVSSVSDTSPEGDVAMSLMMLSKDTWHLGDSTELKHKCDVCDKKFKSTQALGGHRTTHKKAKRDESTRLLTRFEGKKNDKKKTHECPICNKMFGSGQALGGHKRSHFLISPVINASSSANFGDNLEDEKSARFGDDWIDLNMPAPMEDDDEMSAVSITEFNYC